MSTSLLRRLFSIVGRGRVRSVDDSKNVQLLQVEMGGDEIIDGVPRLAQYGFTSSPPLGADVVVVFIGGERSNGCAIATGDQQSRPKGLQPGDVVIQDNRGNTISLTASGITIRSNSDDVNIGGQNVNITGALSINGHPYLDHTHSTPSGTSGPVIP